MGRPWYDATCFDKRVNVDRKAEVEKTLKKIEDYIKIELYNRGILNSALLEDGAIYYMNGNDGTGFDWNANDRICEFMCFWKNNEVGAVKVSVYRTGKIAGYIYPMAYDNEHRNDSEQIEPIYIPITDAIELKNYLLASRDDKCLFDEKIL